MTQFAHSRVPPSSVLRRRLFGSVCVVLGIAATGCGGKLPVVGAPTVTITKTITTTNPFAPPRAAPTAYLNVKDFGAKGDWRTDDSAAIQAALDSVPPAGAVVFFPAGGYLVPNGGLFCDRTVTLLGVKGLDGTGSRIQITADNVIGLQLNGEASVIDSMEIVRAETTASNDLIGVILNNNFAHMSSSRVAGFGTNLRIVGTFYTIVTSSFRNFYRAGVEIDNRVASGDAGDGTITASTFERNRDTPVGGSAVHWRAGGGLRFINNKVNGEKSLLDGVLFEPGNNVDTSVLLVNSNSIENFQGRGVALIRGAGNVHSSLVVSDNEIASYDTVGSARGIFVDQAISSVVISDNSIYFTGFGIFVDGAREATITGNALAKIMNDGITVGGKAQDVTVGDQSIDVINGQQVVRG